MRSLTNPQNSNHQNEKTFYQSPKEEAASPLSVDWQNIFAFTLGGAIKRQQV